MGKERDGDSKNEELMDRWIDLNLARNNLERKCRYLEGNILGESKKQNEREFTKKARGKK